MKKWIVLSVVLLAALASPAAAQVYTNDMCTNGGSGWKVCSQYLDGTKGGMGRGVSLSVPLNLQFLQYDSGLLLWKPITLTLSGDLSGSYPTITVIKLQNVAVSATPPTDQQALVYNSGAGQWQPTSIGSHLFSCVSDAAATACQVAKLVVATGHCTVATGNASSDGDLVIGVYTAAVAMAGNAVVAKTGATVTTCGALSNGRVFRDTNGNLVSYGTLPSSAFTEWMGTVFSAGAGLIVNVGDIQQVP